MMPRNRTKGKVGKCEFPMALIELSVTARASANHNLALTYGNYAAVFGIHGALRVTPDA